MTHLELLLFALILDALLGEPNWIWSRVPHPATLMGRAVEWFDERLNHGENRKQAGVVAVSLLAGLGAAGSLLIVALPDWGILEALLGAALLAQRSLTQHVQAVADALRSDISAGRRAVSMIVGRDPATLDESAVARGAIESAAENFSDGVIAPAFWFLLFGLPGIVVYKIVNTADSMIGHKNERYAEFGWAAARLDDIINWAPARISGGLICLAHWSQDAWNVMQVDAQHHRSPNAGWPEAAMAGVLGIAISGPRSYDGEVNNLPWVNPLGRKPLSPIDIEDAVRVLWRSWFVFVALLATTALVF